LTNIRNFWEIEELLWRQLLCISKRVFYDFAIFSKKSYLYQKKVMKIRIWLTVAFTLLLIAFLVWGL